MRLQIVGMITRLKYDVRCVCYGCAGSGVHEGTDEPIEDPSKHPGLEAVYVATKERPVIEVTKI